MEHMQLKNAYMTHFQKCIMDMTALKKDHCTESFASDNLLSYIMHLLDFDNCWLKNPRNMKSVSRQKYLIFKWFSNFERTGSKIWLYFNDWSFLQAKI